MKAEVKRCTSSLLPSAFCLLPSAFCLLPSAFRLLPSDFCLLTSAFCLLPSAFCLLPSAFCLLPSAFCLLPSAFCLPPTAYCLQGRVQRAPTALGVDPSVFEHQHAIGQPVMALVAVAGQQQRDAELLAHAAQHGGESVVLQGVHAGEGLVDDHGGGPERQHRHGAGA